MQADSKGDVDVVKRLVLNTNNIFDLRHKIERLSIKTRGCWFYVKLPSLVDRKDTQSYKPFIKRSILEWTRSVLVLPGLGPPNGASDCGTG